MKTAEQKKKRKGLPYPKVTAFFKPYLWVFGIMLFLGILSGVVDICLPLFQEYAIENFIIPDTLDGIGVFCLCYVGFLLTRIVGDFISSYQTGRIEVLIARDMRGACFKHLLKEN